MSYRDNAETDYRIIRSLFETASLPQQRRPLRWVGARAKNVFSRHEPDWVSRTPSMPPTTPANRASSPAPGTGEGTKLEDHQHPAAISGAANRSSRRNCRY